MWAARIFTGVIFAGVAFLLWFLVQLLRELPSPARQARAARVSEDGLPRLQLQNEWAAIRKEAQVVTLHSIWRYSTAKPSLAEEEPSCGTSSLYL